MVRGWGCGETSSLSLQLPHLLLLQPHIGQHATQLPLSKHRTQSPTEGLHESFVSQSKQHSRSRQANEYQNALLILTHCALNVSPLNHTRRYPVHRQSIPPLCAHRLHELSRPVRPVPTRFLVQELEFCRPRRCSLSQELNKRSNCSPRRDLSQKSSSNLTITIRSQSAGVTANVVTGPLRPSDCPSFNECTSLLSDSMSTTHLPTSPPRTRLTTMSISPSFSVSLIGV